MVFVSKIQAEDSFRIQKNTAALNCIENSVRQRVSAKLFIFRLAKIIEEFARKQQDVEYIASKESNKDRIDGTKKKKTKQNKAYN